MPNRSCRTRPVARSNGPPRPGGPAWRLIRPEEILVHHRPMTDDQLTEERVEWLPKAPCCVDCAHLGGPVTITDRRQVRRVRRRCQKLPLGHTDSSWTACPSFEARDERR